MLLKIFSRVWTLLFIVLFPHIMLWLLKSPIKINGLGSCFIKLFHSFSFMGSWGGYNAQMETVLSKVAEPTIAYRWVLMLIEFQGYFS